MGVFDKFLNAMKMNDDDIYDEDGYLDEEDDFDYESFAEEKPKRRILSKADRDDFDSFGSSYDAPVRESNFSRSKIKTVASKATSKVAPMRGSRKMGGMEVCVIRPNTMNDSLEIIEILQSECTIILNMEGVDPALGQRIIDVSSGACKALNGNLQRISNGIFIITPHSVDISGDFQEFLTDTFDSPAFANSRY